jgi:hypothetical protein
MLKKKMMATLIPVYVISILLIISCASTSKEVYDDKIMVIPLKSSPQNARVFFDGKLEGVTPTTLIFRYVQSEDSSHDSEARKRILQIEKYGYDPYILSFSINDKEYKKIPNPVFLKKIEDAVDVEALLVKEQQTRQELKEAKEKAEKYLKEITKLRKELKEAKKKVEAEDSLIREQQARQELKKIKTIRKSKVDPQYTSTTIYTIQAGSTISMTDAQKQFDSISRLLNEKELDFLRIEKIGNYHTVRLGKFEDYAAAENLLKAIKSRLSTAIIMKAYIKNERIILLYKDSLSDEKHGVKEKSLSSPVSE